MNLSIVRGTISREPDPRRLADGTELVNYDLRVETDGPTESVPVSWLDPPAAAARLTEGDEVIVTGRVRRRFFRAGGATQSRTEVVADAVLRATQRVRVAAALDRAALALDAARAPGGPPAG